MQDKTLLRVWKGQPAEPLSMQSSVVPLPNFQFARRCLCLRGRLPVRSSQALERSCLRGDRTHTVRPVPTDWFETRPKASQGCTGLSAPSVLGCHTTLLQVPTRSARACTRARSRSPLLPRIPFRGELRPQLDARFGRGADLAADACRRVEEVEEASLESR